MSHIHFTSTHAARDRVISMGEESWRVHRAGAPSLDHLRRSSLYSREEVEQRLGVTLEYPVTLVAYHPVTLFADTTHEADALFSALEETPGQILFCYPNSDAGSRKLIEKTRRFLLRRNGQIFINLDAVTYWSLLRHVDLFVGNSSSGIMETASFALPTVNVGMRQQGRERARNVLDADSNASSILSRMKQANSREFRKSLEGMPNPYGEGFASERILEILTTVPLGHELIIKKTSGVVQAGESRSHSVIV